jgi:hypothetical protein
MNGAKPLECLVVPSMGNGQAEKHFLMREFTTDILRVQIIENENGKYLAGIRALQESLKQWRRR